MAGALPVALTSEPIAQIGSAPLRRNARGPRFTPIPARILPILMRIVAIKTWVATVRGRIIAIRTWITAIWIPIRASESLIVPIRRRSGTIRMRIVRAYSTLTSPIISA